MIQMNLQFTTCLPKSKPQNYYIENEICFITSTYYQKKKTVTFLYTYIELQIIPKSIDINGKKHNVADCSLCDARENWARG